MAKNAGNIATTEEGWETVVEPYGETWDFDKNPVLVGTYKAARTVEQDDLNNPGDKREANVYEIVAADDGETYSVWGTYALDEAFGTIPTGNLVRISFEGKADIGGGRTVRKFTVQTKSA